MKNQNTVPSDGSFDGVRPAVVTNPGDTGSSVSQGHKGYQSPNDYTQYKSQMTQAGWDGTFVGISIPAPTSTDGDNGGSSTSGFPTHSFPGFTGPNEASVPAGPTSSPSNSAPDSGPFPGFGDAGKGGFGRRG